MVIFDAMPPDHLSSPRATSMRVSSTLAVSKIIVLKVHRCYRCFFVLLESRLASCVSPFVYTWSFVVHPILEILELRHATVFHALQGSIAQRACHGIRQRLYPRHPCSCQHWFTFLMKRRFSGLDALSGASPMRAYPCHQVVLVKAHCSSIAVAAAFLICSHRITIYDHC